MQVRIGTVIVLLPIELFMFFTGPECPLHLILVEQALIFFSRTLAGEAKQKYEGQNHKYWCAFD